MKKCKNGMNGMEKCWKGMKTCRIEFKKKKKWNGMEKCRNRMKGMNKM